MNDALKALFDAADSAAKQAYAPYSKFSVGAAIRTPSGDIISGCNVENAAYPAGTCAEAGAIAAMVGACRQRIFEFSDAATRVHLRDGANGEAITHTIDALLPHAFGPRDLACSTLFPMLLPV